MTLAFSRGNPDMLREPFRRSMSLMASAVSMVTTHLNGRPWGMTITACCSVSADPPTVMVSLSRHSAVSHAIDETSNYGLSILGSDAVEVAKFGAAPGSPKFLDNDRGMLHDQHDGPSPCLAGAIAHLDCDVVKVVEIEDHMIYFGRVAGVTFPAASGPLVYCSREYRQLTSMWGLPHHFSGIDPDARVYPLW